MRLGPLVVLVAAMLAPTAVSQQLDTAYTGSWEGAGWVAIQADSFGPDSFRFEVKQDTHTATVLGIEWRHNPNSSLGFETILTGHATEVAAAPPGLGIEATITGDSQSWRLLLTGTSSVSAPLQLVLWDAGAEGTWRWNIVSNATWREVGRGRDAIFWKGEQAAEGLHARAAFEGNGVALNDATYRFNAQQFWGIAGWKQPGLTEGSTVERTAPSGQVQTCPCHFWNEPGEYTLRWSGLDAKSGGMPILVAGVDVPSWVS